MGNKDLASYLAIGEKIKKFRISKGWSQKQFAQKLGIPVSSYSNYENANRTPKMELILKIADVLDVPISELLSEPVVRQTFTTDYVKVDGSYIPVEQSFKNERPFLDLQLFSDAQSEDQTKIFNLIEIFNQLNNDGKEEAIKRLKELTELKKYQINPNDKPALD